MEPIDTSVLYESISTPPEFFPGMFIKYMPHYDRDLSMTSDENIPHYGQIIKTTRTNITIQRHYKTHQTRFTQKIQEDMLNHFTETTYNTAAAGGVLADLEAEKNPSPYADRLYTLNDNLQFSTDTRDPEYTKKRLLPALIKRIMDVNIMDPIIIKLRGELENNPRMTMPDSIRIVREYFMALNYPIDLTLSVEYPEPPIEYMAGDLIRMGVKALLVTKNLDKKREAIIDTEFGVGKDEDAPPTHTEIIGTLEAPLVSLTEKITHNNTHIFGDEKTYISTTSPNTGKTYLISVLPNFSKTIGKINSNLNLIEQNKVKSVLNDIILRMSIYTANREAFAHMKKRILNKMQNKMQDAIKKSMVKFQPTATEFKDGGPMKDAIISISDDYFVAGNQNTINIELYTKKTIDGVEQTVLDTDLISQLMPYNRGYMYGIKTQRNRSRWWPRYPGRYPGNIKSRRDSAVKNFTDPSNRAEEFSSVDRPKLFGSNNFPSGGARKTKTRKNKK